MTLNKVRILPKAFTLQVYSVQLVQSGPKISFGFVLEKFQKGNCFGTPWRILRILCLFVILNFSLCCHWQVISLISILFVVVSTIGMTLNTMPQIQHKVFCSFTIFVSSLFELLIVCCEGRGGERGGQSQAGFDRGGLHILVHHRVSPQVETK